MLVKGSPGFWRALPKQSRELASSMLPGLRWATGSAGPKVAFTLSREALKRTRSGLVEASGDCGREGMAKSKIKDESRTEDRRRKVPPGKSELEVQHSCGGRVNRRALCYPRRPYEIGGGSSSGANGPEAVDWTASAGRQLCTEVGVSRREGAGRRGVRRGADAGTAGGVGRDAREVQRDWAGARPVCQYA